jgi:hypothetical protein
MDLADEAGLMSWGLFAHAASSASVNNAAIEGRRFMILIVLINSIRTQTDAGMNRGSRELCGIYPEFLSRG